jgi:hypothetical protein
LLSWLVPFDGSDVQATSVRASVVFTIFVYANSAHAIPWLPDTRPLSPFEVDRLLLLIYHLSRDIDFLWLVVNRRPDVHQPIDMIACIADGAAANAMAALAIRSMVVTAKYFS